VARTRAELIETLAEDLRPARGPRRVETLALIWLLLSWAMVVAATLSEAPLREGWLQELTQAPRFLLESALGLAVGAVAIAGAFRLGVPGSTLRACAGPAAAVGLLWVGAYVVGLAAPALEPSMAGKREGCAIGVVLYGTPPMLLGLALLRMLAPLRRASTGALVGAAAGAVPGLLMQLACMYVPEHILSFHIAPIALLAAAGAPLGPVVLRRI
jgi:hypothetical protein